MISDLCVWYFHTYDLEFCRYKNIDTKDECFKGHNGKGDKDANRIRNGKRGKKDKEKTEIISR
jgi:hypothetical protein